MFFAAGVESMRVIRLSVLEHARTMMTGRPDSWVSPSRESWPPMVSASCAPVRSSSSG